MKKKRLLHFRKTDLLEFVDSQFGGSKANGLSAAFLAQLGRFYDSIDSHPKEFINEEEVDKTLDDLFSSALTRAIKREILKECEHFYEVEMEFYTLDEAVAELKKMGMDLDIDENGIAVSTKVSEPAAPVSSETASLSDYDTILNLSRMIGWIQGELRKSDDPRMWELDDLVERCWNLRSVRRFNVYEELKEMRKEKAAKSISEVA